MQNLLFIIFAFYDSGMFEIHPYIQDSTESKNIKNLETHFQTLP